MPELRDKPLSYIHWVQSTSNTITDESKLFDLYNEYVRNFYKEQGLQSVDQQKLVEQEYVNLLKDITINYTNIQEKRFLSNIDFNNKKEVDIVLPFFVEKLNSITQYLVRKRQKVQFNTTQNSLKGSEKGVEVLIRDTVVELLLDSDFTELYPNSLIPPVSSIVSNLDVQITPLYDYYQHYFDVDADIGPTFYTDEKNTDLTGLFDANTEKHLPKTWIDFKSAVDDLFAQIPQILLNSDNQLIAGSTNVELGVNVDSSEFDINDLPLKLFLDQKKEDLNLVLLAQRDLIEKYSGTDFYYLSTGSTTTNFVSGLLFEAKNPVANLLNRYWSSHATVPNKLNLKSDRTVGRFFTPDKQGILNYHSLDFYYDLDLNNLLPDAIYVFPDPGQYATGRGNTKIDQSPVHKHYDDVRSLKATRLNQSQEGDIVNDKKMQKFFPYQSREETLGVYTEGVSRSTDDFDFWSGDEKDIWAHSDVYPILPLESPSFDSKIQDLLVTDSIVYEWKTDIYGNDYALLKHTKPLRKTSEQITGSLVKSATQDSTDGVNNSLYNTATAAFKDPDTAYYNNQFSGYTTEYITRTDTITADKVVYDRQNSVTGTLYFRNLYSTDISPASSALSAIFVKYTNTPHISAEINNEVKNFDVIKDVIILETTNYLILEKFAYDLEATTFQSILPQKIFLSLSGANTNLEKFANIYYDEEEDDIYLTKTVLHPFVSGSNYKIIYPNIVKFSNIHNKATTVFSLNTLLRYSSAANINEHDNTYRFLSGHGFNMGDVTTTLSRVSADYVNIQTIDKPLVSINDSENTLTLNYFAHDPACTMYLFNQYYDISDRSNIRIKKLDLFKPRGDTFNYNIDSYFGHVGTSAPIISSYVEGEFTRNSPYEQRVIVYDSVKSKIRVPGFDYTIGETVEMVFNCSLSGRDNTAEKSFDKSNNTVRMGAGVSASFADVLDVSTPTATHSHNSSYIVFNPPLSGDNDDVTVCFDFALYTLTTGNSGYAQINHVGT